MASCCCCTAIILLQYTGYITPRSNCFAITHIHINLYICRSSILHVIGTNEVHNNSIYINYKGKETKRKTQKSCSTSAPTSFHSHSGTTKKSPAAFMYFFSLSLIISSRLGKGTTNAQSLVLSLLVSVTLSPCFMYMVSASLGATGWPSTTWTR